MKVGASIVPLVDVLDARDATRMSPNGRAQSVPPALRRGPGHAPLSDHPVAPTPFLVPSHCRARSVHSRSATRRGQHWFDDGTQYVGSATGQEGFWQRWQDYLNSGHGGNVVLQRDQRDARKAMVSILEVSGSAATYNDIIAREMRWQEKLGTRAKRLDDPISD